jgi:alanine dehydrogenase
VDIGVPKEVKNHEYRVAITPIGVHELTAHGHTVHIETGAGVGSSISDDEFVAAGAKIVPSADDAWGAGEMVLKVKEPVAEEYHRMREGLTLFTYLHLAADKPLTDELLARKVTGIAYETVQLPSGGLPLLYPMSEVAGCLGCWRARSPGSPTRRCSCPRAGCRCSTRCPRWPAVSRPRWVRTRC